MRGSHCSAIPLPPFGATGQTTGSKSEPEGLKAPKEER